MNNTKKYENPEIKIVKFNSENIVTLSSGKPDIDGGSTTFPESWNI